VTFGKDIPDWTGNKLHPVQLGIITIVLSLVALASVGYLTRHPGPLTWQRALAGLGVLARPGSASPLSVPCGTCPERC
jgi:hypothetical protein